MVQPINVPTPTPADAKLGVPAAFTHEALQTDAFKELINKLAWALGSTYRVPYNNTRTPARQLASRIARHVLETQGYPCKIAVKEVE